MAPTKVPDIGLPDSAPITGKDYIPGAGETNTAEWGGTAEDVLAKYEEYKASAAAGANIASLSYRNRTGRGTLMLVYGRSGTNVEGEPDDVAVVEELYGIDIVRDVCCAPIWGPGEYDLDDDDVATVRRACEMTLTQAEITTPRVKIAWASWTDGMKDLRYHILNGQDSYFETGFILRKSKFGIRTSEIKASFTNINTVVTAPSFSTPMSALIDALPEGEWLYKPPQCEHLGRGKWRVTLEWHWAVQWSRMYGGTWGATL